MEKVPAIHFLGKEVRVIIDRPLHSFHPEHHFKYELNYGFIPDTIAPDGEEIDAYIIGVDEPLKEFSGKVKAVIIRKDDIENKLVVCPKELDLNEDLINRSTHFQEQYFDTEIVFSKKN